MRTGPIKYHLYGESGEKINTREAECVILGERYLAEALATLMRPPKYLGTIKSNQLLLDLRG